MARIKGLESNEAGWFVRLVYRIVKRRLGRVILPLKITAHHPRLLRATIEMERGQAAARSVNLPLKALAQIKVAIEIGCPF